MRLNIDHFAKNSNICQSVIAIVPVNSQEQSQYKPFFFFWKLWCGDYAGVSGDESPLSISLPSFSPYWCMRLIVFWIIHRARMKRAHLKKNLQYVQNWGTLEICLHGYRKWEMLYTQWPEKCVKANSLTDILSTSLWCRVNSRCFYCLL